MVRPNSRRQHIGYQGFTQLTPGRAMVRPYIVMLLQRYSTPVSFRETIDLFQK